MKSVQKRRFFWSVFSGVRTEYGKISVFGHLSRSLGQKFPVLFIGVTELLLMIYGTFRDFCQFCFAFKLFILFKTKRTMQHAVLNFHINSLPWIVLIMVLVLVKAFLWKKACTVLVRKCKHTLF